MNKKGFTLIELLVVIAIIGILASVVIMALVSARAKSADAAIKATLGDFRTQAQNYYNSNNNYGTPGGAIFGTSVVACSTVGTVFDPLATLSIYPAILSSEKLSDSSATWVATCAMTSTGDAWAVSVPLKTDNTKSWCVDSTNAGRQITGAIAGAVCP